MRYFSPSPPSCQTVPLALAASSSGKDGSSMLHQAQDIGLLLITKPCGTVELSRLHSIPACAQRTLAACSRPLFALVDHASGDPLQVSYILALRLRQKRGFLPGGKLSVYQRFLLAPWRMNV